MHLSICNVAITLIEEGNYIQKSISDETVSPVAKQRILLPTTLKSLIEEHARLDFSDFLSTLLAIFHVKFEFSEKATKFEKIVVVLLTRVSCSVHSIAYQSKSRLRFFKINVIKSYYTNFNKQKESTLLAFGFNQSINEQGGICFQPFSFIPVSLSIRDFRVPWRRLRSSRFQPLQPRRL